MKILITGGCGFIGSALVSKLSTLKNLELLIIDNFSNSTKKSFYEIFKNFTGKNFESLNIKIIEGDITNYELILNISKDCKYIVHLAASTGVDISIENPRFDLNTNVLGTFNLLESSRINKIKKIIMASSGAVIGETTPPIKETNLPKPISPYGASKLSSEAYANAYSSAYGIQSIVLRFSNVYGPGSNLKKSVISKFIKDFILFGENEIFGDGNQTRDFIYISDLISAIEKSIYNEQIKNEVFQISTNVETKITEVNEFIIESLKAIGYQNLNTNYRNPRRGDVSKNFSDNSKALSLLNWSPKIKINQGIDQTVKYFHSYKESLINN